MAARLLDRLSAPARGRTAAALAAAALVALAVARPLLAGVLAGAAGLAALGWFRAALLPAGAVLLLPAGQVELQLAGVTVPFLEAAVGAGAAAAVLRLATERRRPTLGPAGLSLVAFAGCVAASIANAGDDATRVHTALFWLTLALLYGICAELATQSLTLLGAATVAVALGESGLALAQYASGRGRRASEFHGTVISDRPDGTLGHPSSLAFFLVLSLLPLVVAATLGRSRARTGLAAAASIPIVAALAVTYSRAAWLAAIAGIAVAALAGSRRVLLGGGLIAAVGGLAAALDGPFRHRLVATISPSDLDPGGFRVTLWGRALHQIAHHPWLGAGDFDETALFGGVRAFASHPHELWLGLGAAYGIPAAAAFAVAAAVALRDAVAGRGTPLGLGMLASIVAFLLLGLIDYPFWNESLVVLTVGLLGTAAAARAARPAPMHEVPPFLAATARAAHLSVVVVAWNDGPVLRTCLDSVAAHAGPKREVILVDNGSTDGSIEPALAACPDARLLRNATNLGVARARNLGIAASTGAAILVLDADARLTAGAVGHLLRTLDSDQRIGLVGPRLEYPDGRLQLSARAFPRVRALVYGRPPISRVLGNHWAVREHLLSDWNHRTTSDVDYVLGACQLIRADALADVGLYDDRIFYGPEDADLCLRMHERNWRVLYEPRARVVHRYRRLTVGTPLSPQAWALLVGWVHVFRRHERRAVPRRVVS